MEILKTWCKLNLGYNEHNINNPCVLLNVNSYFNQPIWFLLLNGRNTYSQYLLSCAFWCSSIVSCQYFNYLTRFPKPFSICWNTNHECNDSFAFVRRIFWMSNATTLMCEVAWSQSVTLLCLHYSTWSLAL